MYKELIQLIEILKGNYNNNRYQIKIAFMCTKYIIFVYFIFYMYDMISYVQVRWNVKS